MARGGTVFISTNPQNNVPIGIPGQSIFIGCPGPTIYGRGSGAIDAGGLIIDLGNAFVVDLTNLNIQME